MIWNIAEVSLLVSGMAAYLQTDLKDSLTSEDITAALKALGGKGTIKQIRNELFQTHHALCIHLHLNRKLAKMLLWQDVTRFYDKNTRAIFYRIAGESTI